MATIVSTFQLGPSFTEMFIAFDTGAGNICTDLKLYIGENYLTSEYVDLTTYVGSSNITDITLDITDPLLVGKYTKPVFDGIFTIVITSNEGGSTVTERALINAYYTYICMANKVLAVNNSDKFDELNLLYLFLEASITYITTDMVSLALNVYTKAEAICVAAGPDYLKTDIAECGEGVGCWIVNGVYVKKY